MNANSIPPPDLVEDNNIESDTDTNPDDTPEYYQPISAVDDDDSNQADSDYHSLGNGYHYAREGPENEMSSLHLNDDGSDSERKSSSDESEDEEEERMREASDSAIMRAFREDESRRNAPLTPENAMRVMEAMRGISFGGLAPDWVGRVPEDQWIDQLRGLRGPPAPAPPSSTSSV